jgi:hypothetical protein
MDRVLFTITMILNMRANGIKMTSTVKVCFISIQEMNTMGIFFMIHEPVKESTTVKNINMKGNFQVFLFFLQTKYSVLRVN